MKKLIAFAALSALYLQSQAQSITGTVTGKNSGEALPAAAITVYPGPRGAVTDENGQYTVSLSKPGNYTVEVSYIGYEREAKEIYVSEDNTTLNFELIASQQLLDPVNISAVRAADNVPIAKTDMSKSEIEKRDEGRDVPFILKDMPSTVVSSDAGTGIGYTNMRVRGSDITRINVTVNGIPMNDPESHGVFWVNTPDLISSTNSLQLQRGVGTSTNGAGAFGASLNLKTSGLQSKPFASSEITAGSFNTLKTNLRVGSGLLNDHWVVEGRFSKINSDGFIDRASADLQSYYLSGSYYSENTSVQLIHFGGGEETYQAWWGVPEAKLKGNDSLLQVHIANNYYDSQDSANLVNSDPRTYNYYTYENEVDHYNQDHYQFHLSHRFTKNFTANVALHYTYGRGYYEQYRKNDDLADYGLSNVIVGQDTITSTDLIRRRWLDNDFYGTTYSLEYDKDDLNITFGGAYNRYVGDHFGEIIWARYASESEIRDRYYDNTSTKTDFNNYLKATFNIEKFTLYADLQLRAVNYTADGTDEDSSAIAINRNFTFFNPKAGVNYRLSENQRVYASVGVAQREPVRNDFLDAPADITPQSEFLLDYEAGYELNTNRSFFNANFFYMDYTDQLVLTGELNDVGSALRINVPESYRVGIEVAGNYKVTDWFQVGGNAALSRNKIRNFTEYVFDYGTGGYDTTHYESRDISYSPNLIAGLQLGFIPFKNFTATVNSKFVSQQFMDNTGSSDLFSFSSNSDKTLDAYTVTDFRLDYILPVKFAKEVKLHVLVANLFNEKYEPNGYTYSYIAGSKITENFYFPMAGTNFLAGVKISF